MFKLLAFAACASAMVLPPDLQNLKNGGVDVNADLTGKKLADFVNSNQKLFKAEASHLTFPQMRKRLMDLKFVKRHPATPMKEVIEAAAIPDSFDSRQYWPDCFSLGNIRDQTQCGSCWAFAAAEAISDRTCIASNGDVNTLLSAEDVLSCCGDEQCGGCEGGWPIEAWKWWTSDGLCTGGSYVSQLGCKPYSLPPCGETVNNVTYPRCPEDGFGTPSCTNECTTKKDYDIPYAKDKHFGKSAYGVPNKVSAIQTEIMQHGPVEAAFTVYEDFYQYKSGIYVHTAGKSVGGHAVKILGWGIEAGTPYWTIANSWGGAWGEHGFFRIVRGLDECGMEGSIVAGVPK